MRIERTEPIRFHEQGTLDAVTRWIGGHDDGIAEWFKNLRRQYQADRANVADKHRFAVLLLKDADEGSLARIGLLDVGGATLEDVTAWSTWQDPDASHRGSTLEEEDTQGNGGKAYMYRLFKGDTRILGVRDRRRNCKGFVGEPRTVERGTPGWIPSESGGRELEISSFDAELSRALQPYRLTINDLPAPVRTALKAREAFTLVEGEEPDLLYKGRIDFNDLIVRVVRHEQSTLCLEQVDLFVVHNGELQLDGKKLELLSIPPYPGIPSPIVHEIPEELPLDGGERVGTTEGGTKKRGRLSLHTSADNMPIAYKKLRPRWKISYRAGHQMIGSKPVSELAPATPGAHFIYGTVELPALEPAYVEHGRRRPKDGPLVEALDRFVAEKIRELAHQINDRRKQELDERGLDEVHEENRKLDEFKNRFLPSDGGGDGRGDGLPPPPPPPPTEWGVVPDALEYSLPEDGIHVGKGIKLPLRSLLEMSVRDSMGRPVRATINWKTSDPRIAAVSKYGELEAVGKGSCEIWAHVKGTQIESTRITVQVWNVDHVLLTPRTLSIPLGTRQQIVAEVTDDDGKRSTDVLLDWNHDAEDPLIVRINRSGIVTANRLGRTAITAGAGSVWARIPVEVVVISNPAGTAA